MHAYMTNQYGDLGDLRLADIERPSPAADEVLVRVHAAAVNPADYKVLTGRDGGRFLHGSRFPLVLGYDFSGVVEQVGSAVSDPKVGDEVFGFLAYSRSNHQGTFAEYVSVNAETVGKKPMGTSHVDAACAATCASTALQALRDSCGVKSGAKVLVNGASGGVGSYAVSIAKALGASVWGTSSEEKSEFVKARGADRVIDYRKTRIGDLKERFDVIFDAASSSSFSESSSKLAHGGTYLTLLPSARFALGIVRSLFSSKRCKVIVVRSRRPDLEQLATWMSKGELPSALSTSYPLREVPEALTAQRSNKVAGKIGILVEEAQAS